MLIQSISFSRHRRIFCAIIYTLLISFSFYTFGCTTTSTDSYTAEKVKRTQENEDYEIVIIITKNAESIDVRGYDAKFQREFKGEKDVIVYTVKDTISVTQNGKHGYKVNYTLKSIPLKDILEVYVEKIETNVAATVITIVAAAVITILVIVIIALASKQSCPFFYSFDGTKYVFDAESFGGAITEGLKRTDYSRMEYLKSSDGYYKIMIRNEADETQHIDELKLYAVDHPRNTEVIPDYNGNYKAFSECVSPLKVTDEKNNEVTAFFKSRDGIYWQSQMEYDSSILNSDIRHKLTFDFKKPPDAVKAKLLINAGATLWGSNMFKELLIMQGNKIDEWYKVMDRQGPELQMLKAWQEGEELYDLKLYMKEGGDFVNKNKITSGGPFTIEDRIIDLDLSKISGDEFTLQINPPKGFWKIDYMGIVYEYDEDYQIKELPIVSAEDCKGNNLKEILSENDKVYYDMPDKNDTAYVKFSDTPLNDGFQRTIYMKSTGYYEIHLKKTEPYNAEFFQKILTPGYIVQFSFRKYLEKVLNYMSKN